MGQTGVQPGCSNRQLTSVQVYQYAYNAGFRGAALDEIVAIARAESGWNTCWTNINPPTSGTANKSTKDRGLVQINDWWNNGQSFPAGGGGSLVTDQCAFDPQCSMNWAFKVYAGNMNNFKAFWVTAAQGLEKKFLTNGPVGGTINTSGNPGIGSIGSVNGTTGGTSSNTSGAAGATQTVQGCTDSQGNFDACIACGPKGSSAYLNCTAQIAIGVVPNCANNCYQQSQANLGASAASNATDMLSALQNIGNTLGNINNVIGTIQTQGPSVLIKIGLFLIALITLGMGLFLLANSESLT